MIRLVRPSELRRGEVLNFLEQSPIENVYLIHALRFGGPGAQSQVQVVLDDDAVTGVGYFGRQVVLATKNHAAIEALAIPGIRHERERMIVGPQKVVARYWEIVGPQHAPPRAIRERQPLMELTPERLRGESDAVRVRHATAGEVGTVAHFSALMIEGELGYDPRDRNGGGFETGVAQMIERSLWWVGEDDAGLCFFANIGPFSTHTAQLQGIITPPHRRGNGLATAALAALCRRLFDWVPTLSLFVNDFNTPALRLYERTGFEQVGSFRSILF